MNSAANHPQLNLRFCIEDDAIGTLESTLAIVRRTGAELRNLRAGLGTHGLEVWMRLSASDTDMLALCHTRIGNVVGVVDLLDLPADVATVVPARAALAA